jgi:hypothetical protein
MGASSSMIAALSPNTLTFEMVMEFQCSSGVVSMLGLFPDGSLRLCAIELEI